MSCFGTVARHEHHEAVTSEIIRLLTEKRESRKLSKYVISQRSGVSESMLSLVERGLRNPTMEIVLRIADAIGADLPKVIKKAQRLVNETPKRSATKKA